MRTRSPYAKKSHRIERLNELIRERFGGVMREYFELPPGVLVTVTTVRVSRDLRHARVGLSLYPPERAPAIFSSIRRNLKHLQFLVHKGLTLKFSPELTIFLDTRETEAAKLEAVLDRIKEKHGT